MTDRFQFRWGIPEWDVGSTIIPNPVFQYYSRVSWINKDNKSGTGISNTEAMFILHLASFHYESKKGKAMPSLTTTLKHRMGYKSNQGIINIMQGLEDKNLIIVERRPGQPSIYHFKSFSIAVMKLWKIDNPSIDVDQSTKVDAQPVNKSRRYQSTKVDTKNKREEENPKKKTSSARSADKPKPKTLLAPDTLEARMMFGRLQANAKAKNRRGPSAFTTLECKQKFDAAVAKLDKAEFEKALTIGLEQGINSVARLTSYVTAWANNDKKGKPTYATHQRIAPHATPRRVHTPESAAPFIKAIYGDVSDV